MKKLTVEATFVDALHVDRIVARFHICGAAAATEAVHVDVLLAVEVVQVGAADAYLVCALPREHLIWVKFRIVKFLQVSLVIYLEVRVELET